MRYLSALFLAAALCLPVVAQKKAVPLVIDGETVLVVKSVPFKVIAPAGADDYTWTYPSSVEAQPIDNVLTVNKCPAGEFIVVVRSIKIDFEAKKVVKDFGTITIVFGGEPGPKPPTPPTPPDPPPDKEAPIKLDGLAVLFILESGDQSKLPPNQRSIATSQKIRDYLNSKCVADPSRKDWKAFRMWDKDSDPINEHKAWQDAMKRPRQSVPWIIISTGKTGYEGPLPKTVDETLTLLKKYGG